MRNLRKACAVFMTGLFCWLPVLQPVALYADTVVYDAQATDAVDADAVENSDTGDEASAEQATVDQGDAAANAADVESANATFADDVAVDGDAASGEQSAAPQNEAATTSLSSDEAPAETGEEATDNAAAVGPSEDMPNSWRYDNGTLRADVDPGISLFSMDALPEGATAQGIDVSQWNGTIDWAQVKSAGIDFAILRIGYGSSGVDSRFAANVKGCQDNDIPFGVYVYCYAWNAASARSEAEGTLTRLRSAGVSSSDLSLPVYYDMENEYRPQSEDGTDNTSDPRFGDPAGVDGQNQYRFIEGGAQTFAEMATAFASVLQDSGYGVGIYANLNWWNNYLTDPVFSQWDRWVAQYNTACSYEGEYSAWQHTATGSVPGITGAVDMNWWYGDTPWVAEGDVAYRAHVADIGWQDWVADAETAGTVGRRKSMEALELKLDETGYSGDIEANAHVSDIGWQGWKSQEFVGTTGESKQMEAIEIRLTGELSDHYDVYYCVHSAEVGWLAWAKNGEPAGTQGHGYGMQAIKVKLVEKGADAPDPVDGASGEAFVSDDLAVTYQAHVSDIGWQGNVKNGAVAGTTGQSRSIEALNVSLANQLPGQEGDIQINAHVQDEGWRGYTFDTAGTVGEHRHIEAVQIQLTENMAEQYDVYYRVHAANIGWMAWAKNGEQAGTQGYGYGMEAIQVVLVAKGGNAPSLSPDGVTSDAFRRKPVDVSYQAHVANIGWQGSVDGGQTAGTTGRSLAVEALRVSLTNQVLSGSVQVNAHVADIGWQNRWTGEGGTTGQSRSIQAIQVRLTGEMADNYDIYYRVHSSGYGWLDWAKNGATAGTTGLSCPVEAVQMRLVSKGGNAPGSTSTPYISAPTLSYRAHSANVGWGSTVTSGMAGTMGRSLQMEAFSIAYESDSVTGGVSYRAHVQDIGWQGAVSNGATAGTTGRGKQIEAIQISLTGNAANRFDIYYRVYIEDFGWLGWAKNGVTAGTTSCGLRVEAFEVAVRAKGASAPGSTGNSSYSSLQSLPYIGFQNPSRYPQVSHRTVRLPSYCTGEFTYVSPSRISYKATRNECVNAFITRAYDYLGTQYIEPYSTAPGGAVDCSGLVLQCLYATGMDMGWYNPYNHRWLPSQTYNSMNWYRNNTFMPVSTSSLQRGDVVYYNGHIAIYLGNGQIIDSWPRQGVSVRSLSSRGTVIGAARPYVG